MKQGEGEESAAEEGEEDQEAVVVSDDALLPGELILEAKSHEDGLAKSNEAQTPTEVTRSQPAILRKARTSSLSPPHARASKHPKESQDAATSQITALVNARFQESIDQILDTAKTYFLSEFQEVLFDEARPRSIEERLAAAPGLLISLFQHMTEQRKRKRNSVKNRVTFSNVEEVQYASGSIGNNSADSNAIELSAGLGSHSDENSI